MHYARTIVQLLTPFSTPLYLLPLFISFFLVCVCSLASWMHAHVGTRSQGAKEIGERIGYVADTGARIVKFIAQAEKERFLWGQGTIPMACFPCLLSSEHHVVCTGNDCLDLIKLCVCLAVPASLGARLKRKRNLPRGESQLLHLKRRRTPSPLVCRKGGLVIGS